MNNMYDWVGPRRNFIGGTCPHQCKYCSVKSLMRFPNVKKRYTGKIRLLKEEFKKPLHSSKPIFVGSCFDMFAGVVPYKLIAESLAHICFVSKQNKYMFQSKNPGRFTEFSHAFPWNIILGTTVETNRVDYDCDFSVAPMVNERFTAMRSLKKSGMTTFITIEPIMDFDVIDFAKELLYCRPNVINIGADSKRHNLPEPSWEKVQALIAELKKFTEVRCKSNLERLKNA